jgi:hypothetical protein
MEAAFGGGTVRAHRLDNEFVKGPDLVLLPDDDAEPPVTLPDQEHPR